jgi:hypothetical protein
VRPTLALSLTALQTEAARLQQEKQPLPEALAHLGGINRLRGVIAEPEGELVLLGDHEASLPLIHLDDLAVALRNAYQASPVYQGAPGCSIDPWHDAKDPWRIQTVTVFGMPTSAPMAARHVALDHELKRVSAGLAALEENIPSLYELLRSAAPPCARVSNEAQRTEVAHRFWFFPRYPSSPRFLADAGLVLILRPVEVQLLSEQEFFSRPGQRTGAAPASPQAEQFAQVITQLLATHHYYAHLVSDFRVIEVGKLLRFRQVSAASLHYLLHEYSLTEAPTPAFVGGVRREERGEMVCASQITERREPRGQRIETQEQMQRYHQTFRGGVEVQIELTADQFAEERTGTLSTLCQQVRASRPSSHTILWPIAT